MSKRTRKQVATCAKPQSSLLTEPHAMYSSNFLCCVVVLRQGRKSSQPHPQRQTVSCREQDCSSPARRVRDAPQAHTSPEKSRIERVRFFEADKKENGTQSGMFGTDPALKVNERLLGNSVVANNR
jgi:hypothetical protein